MQRLAERGRGIPRRILLGVAVAVLAGCDGAQPTTPTLAASALATVVVSAQLMPVERPLDGVIEAVNQGTLAAQTGGRVAAILYDVNDFVPADAVVVRLRSTEQRTGLAQAQALVSEATARQAEAQTRYQRIAEMYQRKVVAKASFDEAVANRDAAVARLGAARAGLLSAQEGVAYTEVRAPYAGVVVKRLVQVGETVSPGTPLVSGLSLQFLRVAVDVPQSMVEQVRRNKQAVVYIGTRRIAATAVTIFPEASSPSRTFRTRLELPENATDLYPGMFVKVGFVTGTTRRLLVPTQVIVEHSEVAAVYVVDSAGQTTMRQVRLGDQFADRTEILSGLTAGERVALDPLAAARQLRSSVSRAP